MRRNVIRDLLQAEASEKVIKSIIRPEIEEGQVLQKKAMWMEMEGKEGTVSSDRNRSSIRTTARV